MSDLNNSRVEYVREHRSAYLGPMGRADHRDIAGLLVTDALVLGAKCVGIEACDDWHVVSADMDWILADSKLSLVDCFHRTPVFHQHHRNSTRATILTTAFSLEVFTVAPDGEVHIIKGNESALLEVAAKYKSKHPGCRIVAFKGLWL